MKKFISILSVPAINAGALIYAQFPAFGIFEELFKLLVLVATFIFTLIRIVVTLREHRRKKEEWQVKEKDCFSRRLVRNDSGKK